MDYNKLISVTGLSGLYELISSKSDGAVVRSLEDKTTKFVSSRVHSFSHLESIEVFTTTDNVNLVDIFTAMEASKEKAPDAKADGKTLQAYFKKVYPTMDFERVYSSDMKKMIKWLDILKANNVEIKLSDSPAEGEAPVAEVKHEKPKSVAVKQDAVKNAPAKKINSPRKMA